MIQKTRIDSLDAFRGFTIIAMILVNTPGSWEHVYAPLLHADWHGITPTDFIFPFFIFIVGVAIGFALPDQRSEENNTGVKRKILLRSIKIFAVGLFLWLWPSFDFSQLRWAGVLQRIAIVYLLAALCHIYINKKGIWIICIGIMLSYAAILCWVPVPIDEVISLALETGHIERAWSEKVQISQIKQISDSFIAANLEPGTNLAAWVDRSILPGVFWEKTWDPEGLLSSFPALATCLMGLLASYHMQSRSSGKKKTLSLIITGMICLLIGQLWSLYLPLNKNLWSSSFVLWTGGLALICFGLMYFIIDIKGKKKWAKVGSIFGKNAITAYALSGMLTVIFYGDLFSNLPLNAIGMSLFHSFGLPHKMASLSYAIIYSFIIFIPIYVMHRKKIFIKL